MRRCNCPVTNQVLTGTRRPGSRLLPSKFNRRFGYLALRWVRCSPLWHRIQNVRSHRIAYRRVDTQVRRTYHPTHLVAASKLNEQRGSWRITWRTDDEAELGCCVDGNCRMSTGYRRCVGSGNGSPGVFNQLCRSAVEDRMKRVMGRTAVSVLIGFLLSALTCTVVSAQSTAQISGTVSDQSGAVLPGVEVTATQTETGMTRSVVTNETGSYAMPNLPSVHTAWKAACPASVLSRKPESCCRWRESRNHRPGGGSGHRTG